MSDLVSGSGPPTPLQAIVRDHPQAPLQLRERVPEAGLLPVLAATPGAWDRARDGSQPALPGAVFAIASPDPAERRSGLCAGYLPCGACGACLAGLPLACLDPARPGWNRPGGLASHAMPSSWHTPVELDARELPEALALIAAAGPTYQAMASVGMAPGDAALVVGDPGPGSLPIRLLLAAGLRVLQLVTPAPGRPAPDGVLCTDRLVASELPAARCHLLDLTPEAASLAQWLPIAAHCRSATLCGLSPEPALVAELGAALAGQCTLRWVRDLHPHLVLDLCAYVVTGRIQLASELEVVGSLEAIVEPTERLLRGQAQRWPVLSTIPRH